MTQATFTELEEYSPERFLVKPAFDGAYCAAKVLHMNTGQSVPIHPHAGREVILFPQKGEAVLTFEDGREQTIKAGTIYNQGLAPTFGLKNTGDGPFQTLVLLVEVPNEPQ